MTTNEMSVENDYPEKTYWHSYPNLLLVTIYFLTIGNYEALWGAQQTFVFAQFKTMTNRINKWIQENWGRNEYFLLPKESVQKLENSTNRVALNLPFLCQRQLDVACCSSDLHQVVD